jgi:hypothetical protein
MSTNPSIGVNTISTYSEAVIRSMINKLANNGVLNQQENLAFKQFIKNFSVNTLEISKQLQRINAILLSKITHSYLETNNHVFKGDISFTGLLSYTGSVTPVMTEKLEPFRAFNGAKSVELNENAVADIEIGGIHAPVNKFIELTGLTSGKLTASDDRITLNFIGGPLHDNDDGTIGALRTFTVKVPTYQSGDDWFYKNIQNYQVTNNNDVITQITNKKINTPVSIPNNLNNTDYLLQEISLVYLHGEYSVSGFVKLFHQNY